MSAAGGGGVEDADDAEEETVSVGKLLILAGCVWACVEVVIVDMEGEVS